MIKRSPFDGSHDLFHPKDILMRFLFYPFFLLGRETSEREGRAKETVRTACPVC